MSPVEKKDIKYNSGIVQWMVWEYVEGKKEKERTERW